MRASDPAAALRSFVAAGRQPNDPANRDRRPFVKICGVTDADGVRAAVRAGADAIGLNVESDNAPAIACYTKLGFREVARYDEALLVARG